MEVVRLDALEYLDRFGDGFFDLIVLDPDYQEWDSLIKKGIIRKAIEKTKASGNVLRFTKQPFDYELRIAAHPYFRREIIWTFENGGAWCSPKMPLVSAQKIYWLVKGKQFYFNPRTGVPYNANTKDFKRSKKVFGDYEAEGRQFTKSEEGVWLRDHLHYNKPNSGKIPAKPRALIEILLRCFCPDGGNVCDPFTGSGIVAIAAEDMARNAFASDISEERVQKVLDKCFADCEETAR